MTEHDDQPQARSLPAFLVRFAVQLRDRIRKLPTLTKDELVSKMRSLAVGTLLLATAAVLGVFGLVLLVVAGIAVLSLVMPVWGAALVVAGAVFLVAAILALVGKSRLASAAPLYPQRTIEAVKEDVRWVKTRLRS